MEPRMLDYSERARLRIKLLMMNEGLTELQAINFLIGVALDIYDGYKASPPDTTDLCFKKDMITNSLRNCRREIT